MPEPLIVFLNLAVIFEPMLPRQASALPETGGTMVVRAQGPGESRSAEPLNRLCRDGGGSLVIIDRWGEPVKTARQRLAGCGVTAPFHHDWLAEPGKEWNTGLSGHVDVQQLDAPGTLQRISVRPDEPEPAIVRWRRQHGNPGCIVVDRPRPGAPAHPGTTITIPTGYELTDAIVDQVLAMLRRKAA